MASEPNVLSLAFAEQLYVAYRRDPASVPADWRRWFEALPRDEGDGALPELGPRRAPVSLFHAPAGGDAFRPVAVTAADGAEDTAFLQDRLDQLVRAYRVRGHTIAKIDPLDRPRPMQLELEPSYYGFRDEHLERRFSCDTLFGAQTAPLREILERLRTTYCRSIGAQFMHIDDLASKIWLQERMEGTENRLTLTREEQLRILTRLTDAVIQEEFIQKRYLGAKSFSLEGVETLIPMLDLAIERAGDQGVDEIVIAMAHRGRLNVLTNILGKSPSQMFHEFDDSTPELHLGRGDVKYHMGYSSDWSTQSGHKVHLSLCFNPSHLEYVNPVAMGRMRAKQDRFADSWLEKGLVLAIHGDAAFAGEGVVQETLNLSQLEAYSTGGTIHVITNNQIGFTTPPHESRSSQYASDVAKMLQVPIFHVNGEDPEAVAQVVALAMDFRQTFGRDVVIDLYGYRRRGHNEGDEPAFTQPVLYRHIAQRKTVLEGYLDHLLAMGGVTRVEADEIAERRRNHLDAELSHARGGDFVRETQTLKGLWQDYYGGHEGEADEVETGVPAERLQGLLESLASHPEDFKPHPKIVRLLEARREMARGEKPLDWAAGEALAFATLLTEGHPLRMTGQDAQRGTFSHRHAVLHDHENGTLHCPLKHLAPDQAEVHLHNSPLSEVSVLGFEYGYSLDCPEGLVIWEAQFGDFWNCAQVIVDQFISSAEDKWNRLSALVMLLPHGFEGQGPEHSSARLERILGLAAEDNLQVVSATTPAQLFHLLRRQVLRRWRKPLLVMSPKSLLRHPEVVSSLDELTSGTFERVLPDAEGLGGEGVERLLLCSGKIYYDLAKRRAESGRRDVAIVRVEQLYPLPTAALEAALAGLPDGIPAIWVQEEPENMGAWRFLRIHYGDTLLGRWPLSCVSRPASASPATGSAASHRLEQATILDRAFGAGG